MWRCSVNNIQIKKLETFNSSYDFILIIKFSNFLEVVVNELPFDGIEACVFEVTSSRNLDGKRDIRENVATYFVWLVFPYLQ